MRFKKLIPANRRKVNALVRKQCCNYDNGNCILLDNGDVCACPQMISYSLNCKWFRTAVLLNDKELYAKLAISDNRKKCAICRKVFISSANRAKYCDKCKIIAIRKQKAEYQRKYRSRVEK